MAQEEAQQPVLKALGCGIADWAATTRELAAVNWLALPLGDEMANQWQALDPLEYEALHAALEAYRATNITNSCRFSCTNSRVLVV